LVDRFKDVVLMLDGDEAGHGVDEMLDWRGARI
jgi:hypothetical protein